MGIRYFMPYGAAFLLLLSFGVPLQIMIHGNTDIVYFCWGVGIGLLALITSFFVSGRQKKYFVSASIIILVLYGYIFSLFLSEISSVMSGVPYG